MKDNSIMSRVFVPFILALAISVPVFGSYIQIPDGGITTAKIATGAVTQAKLPARATGTTVAAGGVAVSASSGAFTSGATSFTPVTNLSVTITTTGRPVKLALQSDGTGASSSLQSASSGSNSTIAFFRGATQLSADQMWNSTETLPPGMFGYLDQPAAGTYTYTVQVKNSSSETIAVTNSVLVAYEI